MTPDTEENEKHSWPLSLIHHIQLRPRTSDRKPTRWERLGQIISRIIRSRFGLRSAELADRFFEAKVATAEGEAKKLNAQAIKLIAEAAATFAKAEALKTAQREERNTAALSSRSYDPEARKAEIENAASQVEREVAELETTGAKVEIRIAEADASLPPIASAGCEE